MANEVNPKKIVTFEGLHTYHHEMCDALGLENDTLKYNYEYTTEGEDHKKKTVTAPTSIKGAMDDLYAKTMIMCDAAKKFFDTEYHGKFGQTNGTPTFTLAVSPSTIDMFGSGDTTVTLTATFKPGNSSVKYVDADGNAHDYSTTGYDNKFINQGTETEPVYVKDFEGLITAPASATSTTLEWTRKKNTETEVVYTSTYTFNALDTSHESTEEGGETTYTKISDVIPSFKATGSVQQTQWVSGVEPTRDGAATSHDLSDTASVTFTTQGTWAFQHFDAKPDAKFFNDNYKNKFATCGYDVQTITNSVNELNGGKYGVKYIYIIARSNKLTIKTTAGVSQIDSEGTIETVAGTYYIFHSNNLQSGNLNGLVVTNA